MKNTSTIIFGSSTDHLKRPITPMDEDSTHMNDENVTFDLALSHSDDETSLKYLCSMFIKTDELFR